VKIVLAYSGGVDSAYLKHRLEAEGHEVLPVTVELPDLSIPEVAMNRRDRCYWCKRAMFAKLRDYADSVGADFVADGTNADDLKEHRPGLRARDEMGVRSPLAEAGLTKADVRRLAESAGLAVAVKPSSPCMATRFPYDTELTREKLALAAHAEALVREYLPPSANMRVRCVGGRAAIETDPGCFAQLRQAWPELENRLCLLGFAGVEPEVAPFRSGRWDGTGDFQA
jgi:uncharacterized protein